MTYQVYAQRNVPGLPAVPWAGQRLGTVNGVTIGTDGCYVTAMAQVATHYEHVINPGQLDDILTARGLYVAGDLVTDNDLSKVFPDIVYRGTLTWPGAADLSQLVMADDEEVIIGLDTLNQGRVARHFARVFDYNPKTCVLLIDDPWWGVTANFAARYGAPARNVMKAVRFKKPGWIPPWKRIIPPEKPTVVPTPVPVPLPPAPAIDPRDGQIADLKQQLAAAVAGRADMVALYNRDEAAMTAIEAIITNRKGA